MPIKTRIAKCPICGNHGVSVTYQIEDNKPADIVCGVCDNYLDRFPAIVLELSGKQPQNVLRSKV